MKKNKYFLLKKKNSLKNKTQITSNWNKRKINIQNKQNHLTFWITFFQNFTDN